uniref:Complement C2 n=1 Tax=Pogona vitticeps TaxID=103695 RepID=A0ABM5FHQ2_9SAUR
MTAAACPGMDRGAPARLSSATRMSPFLWAALLSLCPGTAAVQESAPDETPSCPKDLSIRGGTFSLSDGYRSGSILAYSCPPGTYPYPTRSRICQSDGKWTPMFSSSGTRANVAQCRVVRCPPQRAFEHGSFSPRRSAHPVGDILSFECFDGYQLLGSSQRHCLPNGRWNGTSPVCDDGVGHCRSLAIPPGAIVSGVRNQLGDRVSFQCQNGLDLVGSAQRVCTPEGEWSGAEVSCRAPYSYDEAEDVRAEFGASFTNVLTEVSSSGPDPSGSSQAPNLGRRLILTKDGFLYLYLLVDASHSVTEASFDIFKECLQIIINRIASFDVPIKFAIISYASQPKIIVDILDDIAEDPELVLEQIKKMRYRDHGNATGTNIHAALDAVYKMMISDRASFSEQWDKVRHAVILFTDGKSNMKGSPKMAVKQIEDLVNVRENRTDYLDIYAFGVGNLDVDWKDLNEITSKKPGEKHAFVLKTTQELKEAFENVLDPRDLDDICGLANYSDSARRDQKNPWHVLLQDNHQAEPPCRGALISKTWVLTSAHCFNTINNISSWTVILGGGESRVPIKRRIDHELYNVRAKVGQGIKEFYDYDISLLELKSPVQFGGRIRPICLPCTEGANRALKRKSGATTCKDHELELLSFEKVPAQFISLDYKRMNVEIKTKTSRPLCISGAKQEDMLYSQVSDVSEVVTDRFLCSGQDSAVEAATCKGESGGSLFVERRERYFQVGVISWGTYDPCKIKKKDWNTEEIKRARPPPNHRPRDFYISIFAVQDWLRQHLSGSLRFIPL